MKPLLLFFLLLVVAPAQAEERSVSISIIRQERPIRQPCLAVGYDGIR